MRAIFRIRAALSWFTSVFMNEHCVLHLDPEPITGADCEGAEEMFVVTTLLDSKSKATDLPVKMKERKESKEAKQNDQTIQSMIDDLIKGLQKPESMTTKELIEKLELMNDLEIDWVKDHFANPDPGRLTCSSQLGLEFMVPAMGPVYCSLPSFRGEKSKTWRHLASFTHIEAELPFLIFQDLMDFIEEYVTYCLKSVKDGCTHELALLKGVISKLEGFLKEPFGRISYTQAISLLEKNKEALQKAFPEVKVVPKWGEDLGGECERFLSEVLFKKPIFVYNMPLKLKSFYMKKNEGEEKGKETVQGCDLLVPSLGELVGASIRESDYTNLTSEMIRRGMYYCMDLKQVTDKLKAEVMIDLDRGSEIDVLMAKFKIHFGPLQKYVGLRKNAGTPTGGFGLGFERLVTVCTSALDGGNIRDRRPFFATYQDLQF